MNPPQKLLLGDGLKHLKMTIQKLVKQLKSLVKMVHHSAKHGRSCIYLQLRLVVG